MVDALIVKNVQFLKKNLNKMMKTVAFSGNQYKNFNSRAAALFYDSETGALEIMSRKEISKKRILVQFLVANNDNGKYFLYNVNCPFMPFWIGRKVKKSFIMYNQLHGFQP
ncbi:hypothetical protein HN681_03725 [archaeon]|jgi:hypothetical protein|nr:hypothetical protein [archaeon]MBT3730405.1 hypothetical protein [archaeon]MBT4670388.1 hypothetical protein [archaeon]MBT5030147.1 hypothetical protein [archaeon]MBT5288162.1 hypothetical protein [archaeon]